jgi:hypothetical protein
LEIANSKFQNEGIANSKSEEDPGARRARARRRLEIPDSKFQNGEIADLKFDSGEVADLKFQNGLNAHARFASG